MTTREELNRQIDDIEKELAKKILAKHNKVYAQGKVEDVYVGIDYVKEQRYRNYNGKIRIYVGNYSKKTMYRQRKDGTFRIDDIVDNIIARYNSAILREKHDHDVQLKRERNEEVKKRLCQKYDNSEYSVVLSVIWHTGSLVFNKTCDLNEQEADQLYAAYKAIMDSRKQKSNECVR